MKLDTLKDLNKLLILCRKQGVDKIRVGDVEVTFGDGAPLKQAAIDRASASTSTSSHSPYVISEDTSVLTKGWEELTDEERLFYSARSEAGSQ